MDAPVPAGCVVECRLIGVIEGAQTEQGGQVRNDRLLAVARENHTHSDLTDIADLNQSLVKEIGEFFVNYQKVQGKDFSVLGARGPKQAYRLLKRARAGRTRG